MFLGTVEQGGFSVGDTVTLTVDAKKRALTAKNHTATHLLQKALKETLGSHVEQAGATMITSLLVFTLRILQP